MKHTATSLTINSLLIAVLVGMFMLPLSTVHVLTQSSQTDAQVAGAEHTAGDFVVLPNFFDFGEHATFNPAQSGNSFSDSLTVTAFKSQVATYHTVYTLLNRTASPLEVEALLTDIPEPTAPYSMFILSVAPEGIAHTTVLNEQTEIGSVHLTVDDPSIASGVRYVVVDNEAIQVRAVEGNNLLIDPTDKVFKQGTAVHRAGLLVKDGAMIWSNTTSTTLPANGSGTVNAVVVGQPDIETSSITAPLFIHTRRSTQ